MSERSGGAQPSEPVINLEALEAACGEDGARELLQIFLDSTESLLRSIDSAQEKSDGKMLKAHAHEMKGACASIGANEMTATSKNLEQAALAGDFAQSARSIKELRIRFESVKKFCQTAINLQRN